MVDHIIFGPPFALHNHLFPTGLSSAFGAHPGYAFLLMQSPCQTRKKALPQDGQTREMPSIFIRHLQVMEIQAFTIIIRSPTPGDQESNHIQWEKRTTKGVPE